MIPFEEAEDVGARGLVGILSGHSPFNIFGALDALVRGSDTLDEGLDAQRAVRLASQPDPFLFNRI